MNTVDSMYERAYFEIQHVLDGVLGHEEKDGAGEGIVADVRLALQRAEQNGHRAGREAAARDIEATGNYERQARIAREGLRPGDAPAVCPDCKGSGVVDDPENTGCYGCGQGGVHESWCGLAPCPRGCPIPPLEGTEVPR